MKSVQQYFQDALMRKNQTIERLLNELDESEQMYATMMHSHMENIEKMIGKPQVAIVVLACIIKV